jgi:uncharacterized protein YlbG (UPF0298 family)
MTRLPRSRSIDLTTLPLRRDKDRRRSRILRPSLEGLESRSLLSNVSWINPNGGDWDTGANWSTGQVPGQNDNVTISLSSAETITHSSSTGDSVLSLTTNSSTNLKIVNGSLSIGAGSSTFGGPVTVVQGASLNVGAGASVLLTDGQTITDNGMLSFANGDVMDFYSYNGASQIVVNGTMTATGDTFATTSGSAASVQVQPGGHLTAANTTFNLNSLSINNASVYASGDLTGDTFNMSIYVPYGDVQYLAGNAKFQQVYINANTLPSGQTLALNQIGTNTSSLQYVFSGGFTIASGATLSVGTNVSVLLTDGQTITDNGTLSFANGDVMDFNTYNGASQIVVNGTMTATGDTFATTSGGAASVQVQPSGHLTAANTTFNLNSLTINNASVYASGDLTGDTFNMSIYVPYGDVQYLAGNAKFQQVYINANTLPSGQFLSLNQIGANTSSLQYVFSGGFTIASGATLSVGTNVSVLLTDSQTITDNGTLSFANGDVMGFDSYYGASQIVVNGTMTATGDTFSTLSGSAASVQVKSGGQLSANNSNFTLNNLVLNAGSNALLAVNSIANEFSINSGVTINITGNNFSNISNSSNQNIVASGNPSATINLGNNYWGTTNTTQIAAKITDHTTNSSLPTVSYTPVLSTASPTGAVSATVAANTSATFNSSSQSVNLTATVTSGSINVNEGSETFAILNGLNIIGMPVTVAVANGAAGTSSYALPAGTPAGTYTIEAIYYGTGNYLGSIDASHTLKINAASTTTAASGASTTFSTAPQPVSLGATVSSPAGAVNGGSVTFTILNGGTTIASATSGTIVNGAAGATVTLPAGTAVGSYTIQAVYSGTANFAGSSNSSQALTVSSTGTTTAVASSAAASVVGQSVTFTAVVTASSPGLGTPAGTVTFEDGTTTLATEPLTGGAATFTISSLALGTHSITAVYGGSTSFAASTSTALTQTVSQDGTTSLVISSANPSAPGQTVVFTAVVIASAPGGGTPTGSVTFEDGTTMLATEPLSGGTATYVDTALTNGAHAITAVYSGDANFKASTSAVLTQTVGQGQVPTILDSGFETVSVGNGFAIDPTGSAWTFSGVAGNGSGVAGNNSPFTSGNPNAPQGTQVGYIQAQGSITQSVPGWAAGSYTLSFDAAQRGNNGTSVEDFEVLLDGTVVGTFEPTTTSYQVFTTGPFTVTAGSHVIEFLGLDSAGGDNTVFLDAVSVAVSTSTVPTVGDSGFETVNVGNSFAIDPTGSAWTFSGIAGNGSGVAGNNSPFTSGNPNAPQGTQVGYIQAQGSITQSVSGWAAGSYTLSFDAAQRGNNGTSVEDFEVLIDGVIVGTFKPTGTSYQLYTTATFTVTAGAHTIEFLGLDTAGGDNTVFLDAISIASSNVPTVGDSGFEEVQVGTGQYAVDPTGSAWTFSGVAGNGSGVSGNDSPFTSGNPNAPQGSQVGYIEGTGSITQSVAGWAAGSYTISLDAAQRGNYGGIEDFEVVVDGNVVGSFTPNSTSYQAYTTNTFIVTAGSHTIELLGINTAGGDDTDFLDAISIASA